MKKQIRILVIGFIFIGSVNSVIAQWVQLTSTPTPFVNCLLVSGTTIVAATNEGIIRSSDNGASWNKVYPKMTDGGNSIAVNIFVISGTRIFAGTASGVIRSSDAGITWDTTGLTNKSVYALAISGTTIFAGVTESVAWGQPTKENVYRSSDNGVSWIGMKVPGWMVFSLAVSGTSIFVGTYGDRDAGIYRLTDNATSYTACYLNTTAYCLLVSGTTIYAGTGAGVRRSTDNGKNWTLGETGMATSMTHSLAVSGSTIFAGTIASDASTPGSGVYSSSDSGSSWTAINSGLTSNEIRTLVVSGMNIYAGGNGVWRRPLSEVTSVKGSSVGLPEKFTLDQNYPNPFNPSTIISFNIPKQSFVSLKIFNSLGQEVATLASEELQGGHYTRQWNASTFSSGIYFYRLQAGAYTETKRLALVK